MAKFKPCYRTCVTALNAITEAGQCLELSPSENQKLCTKLGDGWTRLIGESVAYDYVQVELSCTNGKVNVLNILPSGATLDEDTELFYDWTDENWMSALECLNNDSQAQMIADLFKDSEDFTITVNDEGKICLEIKTEGETPAGGSYWEWCGKGFTFKNGKITEKSVPIPADQTFDPAKVTMVNGKPVFGPATCTPLAKPSCGNCGVCTNCVNQNGV